MLGDKIATSKKLRSLKYAISKNNIIGNIFYIDKKGQANFDSKKIVVITKIKFLYESKKGSKTADSFRSEIFIFNNRKKEKYVITFPTFSNISSIQLKKFFFKKFENSFFKLC